MVSFRQLQFNRTAETALEVINKMWAESTWAERTRNLRLMVDYARRNGLDPVEHMDWATVVWCQSRRSTCCPASLLKYSQDMASIAGRLNIPMPITRMYQSGLRGSAALLPTHVADALNIEQLELLQTAAATAPPRGIEPGRLLLTLFLMWKTASRYDEVHRLTKDQFIEIQPSEMVIWWRDKTKTTRSYAPGLHTQWTHLVHNDGIPRSFLDTIASLKPDEQLLPRPTEWFNRWTRTALPDARITAHSFKGGALAFLLPIFGDNPDHPLLPLLGVLAKHASSRSILPPQTIGYLSPRDPVGLAKTLGTGKLTCYLPW